ncbi:hypothetical protein FRC19_002504 [Serendipita sp. 401]|nr:hypothetical protein FRC19_002504 [Serendipita sp. 401]
MDNNDSEGNKITIEDASTTNASPPDSPTTSLQNQSNQQPEQEQEVAEEPKPKLVFDLFFPIVHSTLGRKRPIGKVRGRASGNTDKGGGKDGTNPKGGPKGKIDEEE